MDFTKFVALMIVVLVSFSVVAAKEAEAKPPTDCASLKVCLEAVAKQPTCRCSWGLRSKLEYLMACLKREKVVDKCEANRANYICYNIFKKPCSDAGDKCDEKYPQDTTAAEENILNKCLDEVPTD